MASDEGACCVSTSTCDGEMRHDKPPPVSVDPAYSPSDEIVKLRVAASGTFRVSPPQLSAPLTVTAAMLSPLGAQLVTTGRQKNKKAKSICATRLFFVFFARNAERKCAGGTPGDAK